MLIKKDACSDALEAGETCYLLSETTLSHKKERLANIKASQQAQKKKCHVCDPWSKHFELHNDDSRQDRLYNKDISRVFSHVPSMPRKQVKKL